MINIEIILGVIVAILAILGVFFKIVFDYATLKATTTQILAGIMDIKKYLSDHDERLDKVEDRLLRLETEHCHNHDKER